MKKLYHEMGMALEEKYEKIEKLETKNEELKQYIELLEKSEKIEHQGKDISETKKKSRTQKIIVTGRNCFMVCKISWTGIEKCNC
jgi:CHASE3 domain sensor protein